MKKLNYIPGIISATGLVLLFCFVIVPASFRKKHETVIRFVLPSDDKGNRMSGDKIIEPLIKAKKTIRFALTGDAVEDDKKISVIQQEARRLKYTGDTLHLIKVQLSEGISYGRFVQLLNMMLEDGHRRYALWKGSFYIIFDPSQPAKEPERALI